MQALFFIKFFIQGDLNKDYGHSLLRVSLHPKKQGVSLIILGGAWEFLGGKKSNSHKILGLFY
jgi:hypothetical protein